MKEPRLRPRLRLAVLGDFDGSHTRRWLRVFIERGHEVHAISFYTPSRELPGVRLHVLRPAAGGGGAANSSGPLKSLTHLLPPSVMRLLQAERYRRAGLQRVLAAIRPDVFHAHYVVEHGFYGARSGYHPYVVSAWGSDLYVESFKLLGSPLARFVLARADLVTINDLGLAQRASALGVPPERLAVVALGLEDDFLPDLQSSVNLSAGVDAPPTVFSHRALEPLYGIERLIRGFALLRRRLPMARLQIAGEGSQSAKLEMLARDLDLQDCVQFLGRLEQGELRQRLLQAHVYVSIPSSDSFALSNLEAMASGALPILSDLVSAQGWIEDGKNGFLLKDRSPPALASLMETALADPDLRREAALTNRARVEADGMLGKNMLAMEEHYYRLAGMSTAAEAG